MSTPSNPDRLPDWISDHLRRYRESNGADGHMWDSRPAGGPGPIPTLLLTTTGRKSKRPKVMPLIYAKAPGGYALTARTRGSSSSSRRTLCTLPLSVSGISSCFNTNTCRGTL